MYETEMEEPYVESCIVRCNDTVSDIICTCKSTHVVLNC